MIKLDILEYVKSKDSAKEYIESFVKYVKGGTTLMPFSILLNPTRDELKKVKEEEYTNINRMYPAFSLRALLVDKTKLYAWYAELGTHWKVEGELNLKGHGDMIPLFIYLNNQYQIEYMAYSPEIKDSMYDNGEPPGDMWSEQYYNKVLVPILKVCPAIKSLVAPNVDWELTMDS